MLRCPFPISMESIFGKRHRLVVIRKNMGVLHEKHQCPCVLVVIRHIHTRGCNASPQPSGITINVSNAISLKEGATYQIERSFIGSEDIVAYRSDNEEVAKVSDTGLVTALKEDTANISLTLPNYKRSLPFMLRKRTRIYGTPSKMMPPICHS